jgi:HAD superfamily hydrolase (TIGR01509 family)
VIERHERSAALNARWMPGADTLLHQLRERRLPLGIVTRNSRSPAALTLARLGAPPLQLLCREDARPKPDPDGLLQLARSWSLPPQALVYIGDFHFDLEAATAAGMLAGLYAPGEPPAFSARADFIFSDFASLAELLPGSGRPD